jgi:Flp pilus assembly protein TadD
MLETCSRKARAGRHRVTMLAPVQARAIAVAGLCALAPALAHAAPAAAGLQAQGERLARSGRYSEAIAVLPDLGEPEEIAVGCRSSTRSPSRGIGST